LADFFTKPFQGSLLKQFWSIILGHKDTSWLITPLAINDKEHVEKDVFKFQGAQQRAEWCDLQSWTTQDTKTDGGR
jgi:hypothetical protein